MMDYSGGEYPLIKKYFETNAPKYKFLVDVGAHNIACNSYNLIMDDDWSGVLVEPSPDTVVKLRETYKDKKLVTIEQLAILDTFGEMDFFLHPGSSSLNTLKQNDWYKAVDQNLVKKIKVQVRPIAYVLSEKKIPLDFDYLTIDAEGFDWVILNDMFNNSPYRPSYIVHEISLKSIPDWKAMMDKNGYNFVAQTQGNLHYCRR
jgi:FkbM family methyltransferase